MASRLARDMRNYARRRIVPLLKESAPKATGELRNSLDADMWGRFGIVIGALRPPFWELGKRARRRHPGVYGYILNQGSHPQLRRGKTEIVYEGVGDWSIPVKRRRTRRFRHRGTPLAYRNWFTRVTKEQVPRMMKKFKDQAAREYLEGENNDAR